jgi:hypothetical protein
MHKALGPIYFVEICSLAGTTAPDQRAVFNAHNASIIEW